MNGFTQSGMGVNGRLEVFEGGLQRHGQPKLPDQLGGLGSNQVSAQYLPVSFANNQLDKPLALANRQGLATGTEREATHAVPLPPIPWPPVR